MPKLGQDSKNVITVQTMSRGRPAALGSIMSTLERRRDQMFPKLRPEEIDRLRRFGEIRRYAVGDLLFVTGEPSPGMFVLIDGTVAVSARDGLGHVVPIVEEGPGEFLAEVGQLAGRPALVDARAKTEVEACTFPPNACAASSSPKPSSASGSCGRSSCAGSR
jgi:thioredoxin reductase (NADPH)